MLLLEKEIIHLFVVRDLREFFLVHLVIVLDERQIFLQHVTVQLHPCLREGVGQCEIDQEVCVDVTHGERKVFHVTQFVDSAVFVNVFSSALVAVYWNFLRDGHTAWNTLKSKTKIGMLN